MPDPAVSVVVPTRDRADYLAVTLASLGTQTPGVSYEVIVVDDGSSDATAEAARRAAVAAEIAADSGRPGPLRVAYVRHERSRGPNAARNAGIAAARAPLIA